MAGPHGPRYPQSPQGPGPQPDRYAWQPGPYRPNGPDANPTRAVPGPVALENRGYWSGSPLVLQFTLAPLVAPLSNTELGFTRNEPFARALWQSPIFDLRPDLGASSGADHALAKPINRSAAFGAGAQLTAMITNTAGALSQLSTLQQQALEVYTVEYGHPALPNAADLQPLNSAQNVTTHLWAAGAGSAMLPFSPPGNPMRYWSVALVFDVTNVPGVDVTAIPSTLSVWATAQ